MKKIILITAAAGIFASCKKADSCYYCTTTFNVIKKEGERPTFNYGNNFTTCGQSKSDIDALIKSKLDQTASKVGDTDFVSYNCSIQ